MKLKLIALSLVLSAASTSAFAIDGGQVDFAVWSAITPVFHTLTAAARTVRFS
ncbi:hypothetical protein ACNJN1_17615 [Citrobacter freundii]